MSILDPEIVKEFKKSISKFLNRETDVAQAAVVARQAGKVVNKGIAQQNPSLIQYATSVLDNTMKSDVLGDNNPVDQEARASVMQAASTELHALEGAGASDPSLELRDARKRDAIDEASLEEAKRADLECRDVSLQLSCMHCPDAPSVKIAATADCYSELMWERIEGAYSEQFNAHLHCGDEGRAVSLEVWTRRRDEFPWGESYFWTYRDLSESIDPEDNVVDIVNVESVPNIDMTRNYLVLSWNENGKDVAFL